MKQTPEEKEAELKKIINRFNRIKGQIEGITKMIKEEKDCPDIFNQIKSVKSSLNGATESFLKSHLNKCLLTSPEERDEILKLIFKN